MVRCSVYIVYPAVLSCSNLKLHQTLEMKNIFKQEKIMLQLNFNPGLALTGIQTTRPCFEGVSQITSVLGTKQRFNKERFQIEGNLRSTRCSHEKVVHCSRSQKNTHCSHARKCSQRPFDPPNTHARKLSVISIKIAF